VSLNAVRSFSSSIPGKIFLLGEYAALADRPALVATLGPRFRSGSGTIEAHPRSPAGRLLEWARSRGVETGALAFEDPLQGAGGFGASTAQFALAYRRIAAAAGLDLSAVAARRVYRELMRDDAQIPSGADLIAQWTGGVVHYDPARDQVTQCWDDWNWNQLLVFSAVGLPGRKVATHEHLGKLTSGDIAPALVTELERVVAGAMAAKGDARVMGRAMTEYADALHGAGLEVQASYEDRCALAALPGVLGAKGAGALLSDAVLVWMEPSSPHRAAVIAEAVSRGLRLAADGLDHEEGISS
jgi:mevalonate kinase